jgi:hypothetical protein
VHLTCDVCGKSAVGVASSSLGAISYAYCNECLLRYAEPVTAFEITYEVTSGDVADWVKELTTYVDGKYLTWDEWVGLRNKDG